MPALLPDYEREKLKAEMLLNKAAYGACLPWIVGWRRRRSEVAQLVERDADALIEQHGIQAYGVSGWRAHQIEQGKVIDDGRPAGHWRAVKRRIPKLTSHDGLDNATRRGRDL